MNCKRVIYIKREALLHTSPGKLFKVLFKIFFKVSTITHKIRVYST